MFEFQIGNIQSHQLGTAKSARKSDEQKSPIPSALQSGWQHSQHQTEILGEEGRLLFRSRAMRALDAFQCFCDQKVINTDKF